MTEGVIVEGQSRSVDVSRASEAGETRKPPEERTRVELGADRYIGINRMYSLLELNPVSSIIKSEIDLTGRSFHGRVLKLPGDDINPSQEVTVTLLDPIGLGGWLGNSLEIKTFTPQGEVDSAKTVKINGDQEDLDIGGKNYDRSDTLKSLTSLVSDVKTIEDLQVRLSKPPQGSPSAV